MDFFFNLKELTRGSDTGVDVLVGVRKGADVVGGPNKVVAVSGTATYGSGTAVVLIGAREDVVAGIGAEEEVDGDVVGVVVVGALV